MRNFSNHLAVLVASFTVCQSESNSGKFDDVKCEAQLKYFSESLSKRDSWAVELFDSWTKFQAGVTFGNLVDFGNFEQCVDFKHESSSSSVGFIQGQHCLIYYRAMENAGDNASTPAADGAFDWIEIGRVARQRNLRLGGSICLPSSCTPQRIQSFAGEYLASAALQVTNDYDQSQWCQTADAKPFETIDIVCTVILSVLLLLLLSSTAYELTMIRSNHKPHEIYSAFSIYKNGAKLFHVSKNEQSNVLQCLAGLRTFAMLHIMLGHRFGWTRGFPNVNAAVYAIDGKWMKTLFSAFVTIHPIAVDTFFVMGGLLVARSMLNNIEKEKLNIPKMYLHRYLRTMPVFGVLILIILSILKHFGDGPYFDFLSNNALIYQCRDNWWAALLHIQNYYCPLEVCLPASWYLSTDFQLILISPLIMYPAFKWGWKFLWLLPTYIIGTEVWVFVIAWQNEYKAARLLMPYQDQLDSAVRTYFPTHIRCGPWLIGVMLGYILHQTRNRKIVINKYVNTTSWIISISTLIAILVGMLPLQSVDNPAGRFANSFWMAVLRNSWGLAIAWVILACHSGSGGIFKWFLELPCWQPLGRMSLSFYLVHSVYQTVSIGSGKVPIHFNMRNLLHSYAGDFVVSFFLATLFYLTLEEPILLIENYIYKQIAMRTKKDSN